MVRSPAGLSVGASGQEEISLSIMAEIVSLRAKLRPTLREEPTAQPEETVDPVCGMTVEVAGARHAARYGGRAFYFCCPGCKRKFEAEPEKYVSPISA